MKSKKFQNASLAELYSRYGILLILVVALIAGAILSPAFLVPSNLISVAKNVGVYAIMALGMTRLLIGGGVDLSAGSNVAMCSVVAAVVFNSTENSLLALVAAIWMAWTQELAIRAGGQEVPYGVTAPAPGVWELLVPWSGR